MMNTQRNIHSDENETFLPSWLVDFGYAWVYGMIVFYIILCAIAAIFVAVLLISLFVGFLIANPMYFYIVLALIIIPPTITYFIPEKWRL